MQVVDLAYGAAGCIALNDGTNNSAPIENADSYTFFARWSWLGLWGDGRPGTPCRDQYIYMDIQSDIIALPSGGQSAPVSVPAEYANGSFSKRENDGQQRRKRWPELGGLTGDYLHPRK